MFKQEYTVHLVVEATHEYVETAVSEEAAVAQAEARYERNDYGFRIGHDVILGDAFGDEDEGEEYD